MESVSVRQARAQLSKLLVRVGRGEHFVITRGGKPMARLVPLATVERRRPGAWKGLVRYGDDLADPLPADVAAAFFATRPRESPSS